MTIEQAVVQKLGADATLASLAPGGVWLDVAPETATEPYLIVNLQSSLDAVSLGEGLAFEDALVLVKAVDSGGGAAAALAADARVFALLHGGTLTVSDGTLMSMTRYARVRYVEVEGDQRWQHVGSIYAVTVSR